MASSFFGDVQRSGRFLPGVGLPNAVGELPHHFASVDDAALFLLLTCWDDAFRGGQPEQDENRTVAHYRDVFKHASNEFREATFALLRSPSDDSISSLFAAGISLANVRRMFVAVMYSSTPLEVTVSRAMEMLPTSLLIARKSGTDADRALQSRVEVYVTLLLTQDRSCKREAVARWKSFAQSVLSEPPATGAAKEQSERCTLLFASALSASCALCCPRDVNGSASTVSQSAATLVRVDGAFVALFWALVVQQCAAAELESPSRPAFSPTKILTSCLVDLFLAAMFSRIRQPARIPLASSIVASNVSVSEVERCAMLDVVLGEVFPVLWQQFGFEWPWSAVVRETRRIVNDERANGGPGTPVEARVRVDVFWADVVDSLKPRAYRARLEQVFPNSLTAVVADAFALEVAESDASHVAPLARRSTVAVSSLHTSLLSDLQPIVRDVMEKVKSAADSHARAVIWDLALLAIDAVPCLVQARQGSLAEFTHWKQVSLLWAFFASAGYALIPGRFQPVYEAIVAPRLESLRSAMSSELRGGVLKVDESGTANRGKDVPSPLAAARHWGNGSEEHKPKSPFADLLQCYLMYLRAGTTATGDEDGDGGGRLLILQAAQRILGFMTTVYLSRSSTDIGGRVQFSVMAGDFIAVLETVNGLAHLGEWVQWPLGLRMLVKGVTARIRLLLTTEAEPVPVVGVDRHLLQLEMETWKGYLTRLLGEKEVAFVVAAFRNPGVLQRTMVATALPQ